MCQAAKRRATLGALDFDLTPDYLKTIWPKGNKCPVLGTKFGKGKAAASLDKLNPKKGYVQGNVAVISLRANLMKSDVTDPKLFRRLADWMEGKT